MITAAEMSDIQSVSISLPLLPSSSTILLMRQRVSGVCVCVFREENVMSTNDPDQDQLLIWIEGHLIGKLLEAR
jgi:hypothetical protein